MALVFAIFGSVGGLLVALFSLMILDLSLYWVLFTWMACGMTATLGLLAVALRGPQRPIL